MKPAAPAFAAVVTAISGFALMGGSGDAGGAGAAQAGARGFGQVSLSSCAEWRTAGPNERARVLDRLGSHFESSEWAGHKMPDGEARAALDRACRNREARNIRLYKIYARALAFGPLNAPD